MNIKKFVNVTISSRPRSTSTIQGVRPALLIGYTNLASATIPLPNYTNDVFTNVEEITNANNGSGLLENATELYEAAKKYFEYGGEQLTLAVVSNLTDAKNIILNDNNSINVMVIPTKYISGDKTYAANTLSLLDVKTLAENINGDKVDDVIDLNNKNIFYDLKISTWGDGGADYIPDDIDSVEGLVVHLVNVDSDYLSIKAMAYISNQNFNNTDVKPYLYTTFLNTDAVKATTDRSMDAILDVIGYGDPDNNKNFNAYCKITNGINAILGGKDTRGNELVHRFNGISIQKDLTDLLLTYLITNKPTFSSTTITETINILTDYLDIVAESGWLASTRIENDQAKIIIKNGISYTLLSAGEILTYGYKVSILPFSRQDITDRAFRDIYVVLSTAKGIMTIELKGDLN